MYEEIARLSISFKEARDTFYIKEINEYIVVNKMYNPLYITTDQISNVRCVLNKISSLNLDKGVPRYLMMFQNDMFYFKKINPYYKYIINEETLNDINKINIDLALQHFIPNIQKKFKIKNDSDIKIDKNLKYIKYNNKYTVMDKKTEHIKKTLFDLFEYVRHKSFDDDFYDNVNINYIFNQTDYLSTLCSFDELMNLNIRDPEFKSSNPSIFQPSTYLSSKLKYEKYFKTILDINEKDYFYAFVIGFTVGITKDIYKEINNTNANFLSEGVYNAILALKSEHYIFEDKLDKGIVIERIIKNKFGDVIDTEYEEVDGSYEMIYGDYE